MSRFPTFEFHIAGAVRDKYGFGEDFFTITGNVVLADFGAVRAFVHKLNARREARDRVAPGQVNAAGLLDEIYHYFFRVYESRVNPGLFTRALRHLAGTVGEESARALLRDFVTLFPPREVRRGAIGAEAYLRAETAGRPNAEITLEELVLLDLANFNPANAGLLELFDERYFPRRDLYRRVLVELERFFKSEETFGPRGEDLFAFFKGPIRAHPDSLEAQLEYIRDVYGLLLEERFLRRILSGKDLIREDTRLELGGPGGSVPAVAPQYLADMEEADFLSLGRSRYRYARDARKDYAEPENFTPDTDWMPRVVLLAKNIFVWLDQLSKAYGRPIRTLDLIPDEELDRLARWNFSGLWLIGVWERSPASKRIKHIMGNIDAVSSAYSLFDYEVARDLGGDAALANLNERARARGIRLASDMVPNHTGLYSRWLLEHPERFIQTAVPPFPGYSFSGPDLSFDPSIQLRIEDGYWRRSDAAVVFQRIDGRTGEVRYIYHGNDGTNMPWNDTAQLDLLRAETREALIRKIFDVSGKFSIIRFDAAMTLTKRHFARLWYPEPGCGGDIPSRADHGLTREEFEAAFPAEFWREVVDRINAERPETLLLAEAFWLMEGYFVRSLGMHRVYNSAFMHMLMKEENAKYRDLISNTLEFEPEILKRYVNFMSNPDEETAIRQFGTDDKYFGVCTLMVTLPGLPMFAHGQIEGLTEKYGMEYQRAYSREAPSPWLIERHQREIFPLMRQRRLFSQVGNFWLFDVTDSRGAVNENVFAFTNGDRGERAFILYNNKYERAAGTVFRSSPKMTAGRGLGTRTVAEALSVNPSPGYFYVYREHVSGLEFLLTGSDLAKNGFRVELDAFKRLVCLDWREVHDETGDWEKLAWRLGRKGRPDIFRALEEMRLEPIHQAFEGVFDEPSIRSFVEAYVRLKKKAAVKRPLAAMKGKVLTLLTAVKSHFRLETDLRPSLDRFEKALRAVRSLNTRVKEAGGLGPKFLRTIPLSPESNSYDDAVLFLLGLVLAILEDVFPAEGPVNKANAMDALWLDSPVRIVLRRLGRGDAETSRAIILLNIRRGLTAEIREAFSPRAEIAGAEERPARIKSAWAAVLDDESVRTFLGVNRYEGVWYYSKEAFEEIAAWMFINYALEMEIAGEAEPAWLGPAAVRLREIEEISSRSEYRLADLRARLESPEPSAP